jgi:hypothetical protein
VTVEIQIVTNTEIIATDSLRRALETRLLEEGHPITFESRGLHPTRGIDATVLVAIVGAAGTAVGAVIAGVIQIAQKSRCKKIVLQGKGGQRIEVPADTDLQKIKEFVDEVRRMDADKIRIALY